MIVETALRVAGENAHLVHRPGSDVLHVYVGPLTPSERYVPRAFRAVCRAHTRRLRVLLSEPPSSLLPEHAWRLCARCSARLSGLLEISSSRRAGHPSTRDQYQAAYAGTTPADVAFALELAETPEEVDAAAHLSLVLFGHRGCLTPARHGRTLHQLVTRHRAHRDRTPTEAAFDALVESGYAHHKARRQQLHHEREERITRLGMNLAKPNPPKPAR